MNSNENFILIFILATKVICSQSAWISDFSYIPSIKAAAQFLVGNDVIGDPLMIQKADKSSGSMTYYFLNSESSSSLGTPVFRIPSLDNEKQRIHVLEDGEDFIQWTQNKRVYVVLRRSDYSDKTYVAFYAYVRGHNNTHPLVEFDQWDSRGAPHHRVRLFGWVNCDRTFITPCRPTDVSLPLQVVQDGSEYSDETFSDEVTVSELKVALNQGHPGRRNLTTTITAQYLDITYDLMLDLDYSVRDLNFIRTIVSTVTYALTALTASAPPRLFTIVGISPNKRRVKPENLKAYAKEKKEIISRSLLQLNTISGKFSSIEQSSLEAQLKTISQESIELLHMSNMEEPSTPTKRRKRQSEDTNAEDMPFIDLSEENFDTQHYKLIDIREMMKKIVNVYGQNPDYIQRELKLNINSTLPRTSTQRHTFLNHIQIRRIQDLMNRVDPSGHQDVIKLLNSSLVGQQIWAQTLEEAALIIQTDGNFTNSTPEEIAFVQTQIEYETGDIKPMRSGGLLPGDMLAGLLKIVGLSDHGISRTSDMDYGHVDRKVMPFQIQQLQSAIFGTGHVAGGVAIGKDAIGVYFGSLVGAAARASVGLVGQSVPDTDPEVLVKLQEILGGPNNPLSQVVNLLERILSKGSTGLNSGLVTGLLGIVEAQHFVQGSEGGIAALVETDIFTHTGWRSKDLAQENLNEISTYEGHLPFLGFGNCPVDVATLNYSTVQSLDDALEFYPLVWRTGCVSQQKDRFRELLATGWIRIIPEGTVGIRSDLDLLWKRKLNKDEADLVSLAMELEGFAEAFTTNLKIMNNEPKKGFHFFNPLGAPISPSIDTLVLGTLRTIHLSHHLLKQHFIKMARNGVKTLKTAFTKVLQDYYRLKVCPDCTKYVLLVARNDIEYTYAAIQYLLTDLYSVDRPSPMIAFRQFFKRNNHNIAKKLKILL